MMETERERDDYKMNAKSYREKRLADKETDMILGSLANSR